MLRAQVNFNLADRIDTYNQGFIQGNFCSLRDKAEACPLTCSVNRSASLGYPWKTDDLSKRRGRDKAFNPRRSAYEMQSSNLPQMKKARPWYKLINADVLQQALLHLHIAFQTFFEGRAKFPRFKTKSTFKSFEYKPKTVRIEGNRIKLPSLGWVKFYKSRNIPKSWESRTVTISKEPDGWYASILLRDDSVPELPVKKLEELKTVTGVDRGIKKIVALTSGEVVANPNIGKRNERRIAIRQRAISRKKKGSNNRAKAGKKVARVHQKIKNERDDFQWKLARTIAESADVIGFEDLNIKGMKSRCSPSWDESKKRYLKNGQVAKSQLNKAISDAAWNNLLLKTKHQATKLGNWVVQVPARHSSQECSQCHFVSPKNRDKEKFVCENCGHHDDADVDAACIIAQRARDVVGLPNLPLVRRKVMPVLELTGTHPKEISLPLGGEPGNQTKKVEYVQLSLFDYLLGESPTILRSG